MRRFFGTFLLISLVLGFASEAVFARSSKDSRTSANKNHFRIYSPEVRDSREFTTNELFRGALERSAFRHKVLSENMANVNTPNYKANEVEDAAEYEDLVGEGRKIRRVRMKKTSSMHIGGKHNEEGLFQSEKLKDPYEVKPNGNNVSTAQQMTKLSQNQQDYNAAVKSYATTNALISAVLGK